MDKRVATELIKTRKAVKRKYQSLQSDIAESRFALEQQFKPLSQPIKELLSTIKSENVAIIKRETEPTGESEFELKTPSRRKKRRPSLIPKRLNVSLPESSFVGVEDADDDVEEVYEGTAQDEAIKEATKTIQEMMRPEILDAYLDAFTADITKDYVQEMIQDTEDKFDHHYGIQFNIETDKFTIGNKDITFDKEDMIIMEGNQPVRYKGTPGFYELMFKKEPRGYNKHDWANYKDIVKRSAADRVNYDPMERLSGNGGKKYVKIIKPVNIPSTATVKRRGKGLLNLDNKQVEFVPYKNPNTIVNRLQILVASQMAGHTGHNNEIIRIIAELKRTKIIK